MLKTKIKESSGSSGPAPKKGLLPSWLTPCLACRLCQAILAAHVPVPLTAGMILSGASRLFLSNSFMKERVLCSGEWLVMREQWDGAGRGTLVSFKPVSWACTDMWSAPFRPGILKLEWAEGSPGGLVNTRLLVTIPVFLVRLNWTGPESLCFQQVLKGRSCCRSGDHTLRTSGLELSPELWGSSWKIFDLISCSRLCNSHRFFPAWYTHPLDCDPAASPQHRWNLFPHCLEFGLTLWLVLANWVW